MNSRAESIRAMHPLFQTGEGGSIPTSALQLRFQDVNLKQAKYLNRLWHSRFPENGGGGSRARFAAHYDGRYFASAIWTNPTSPKLPQKTWMLLKRFAIAPDRPAYTASRMMGWMIRTIKQKFPDVQMLVSYSDPDSHDGTIYRATGWIQDGESLRAGVMWHNRGRDHTANQPCNRVIRWLYPIWIGPLTRNGKRA